MQHAQDVIASFRVFEYGSNWEHGSLFAGAHYWVLAISLVIPVLDSPQELFVVEN